MKTLKPLYDVVFAPIISYTAGACEIVLENSHVRRYLLARQRIMLLKMVPTYRIVLTGNLRINAYGITR